MIGRGKEISVARPHRVVSISMYIEDLSSLDRQVEFLQSSLSSRAIDRSKVIRLALSLLSDETAASHLGTERTHPSPGQKWSHRRSGRVVEIVERFWTAPSSRTAQSQDMIRYRFTEHVTHSGVEFTAEVSSFEKAFRP